MSQQRETPVFQPRPGRGFGRGARGPVVKPKNFKGTLKRLWHAFGVEKKIIPLVFLIVLVDAVLMLSAPYLIGKSIDVMTKDQFAMGALSVTVLALLAAYLADGILTFWQSWIMAGLSQRIVKNLRRSLFEKMQKLPLSYFDSRTHGEIMSRLTNDIDNVSNSISQSTAQLMSGVIMLAGSLMMMLVMSPILTLACLITVPLVFLLTKTIATKTSVLFKNQQVELGKLNGHIEETISGIQVVKAFNHEQKAVDEFDAINRELCKVGLKAQIWSGFLMPIMNVINNLGFAMVAIVGGDAGGKRPHYRRCDCQLSQLLAPVRPAAQRPGQHLQRAAVGCRRCGAGV